MKILIELPSWLGDSIMATPAIENILNHFYDSEITLIGSEISIEALKNHPRVDGFRVLNKKYLSLYKTAKQLGSYEIYFSFRSSLRSKLLKLLIRSNNKYQFDKDIYKNRHQVEKYNDFINEVIDQNLVAGPMILHTNRSNKKNNNKVLGINPGSSYGNAKRWYPREFAKVASELSTQFDINIYGGPNEVSIANEIEKILVEMGVKNFKNLAGTTTISDVIKSIAKLDLFITGDSGPMHIAACFNIPTIAIFGPTRDDETSQWMNIQNINIKKNLSCQPCMKRTCPLGHHDCMKLIKAVDVLKAVKSL